MKRSPSLLRLEHIFANINIFIFKSKYMQTCFNSSYASLDRSPTAINRNLLCIWSVWPRTYTVVGRCCVCQVMDKHLRKSWRWTHNWQHHQLNCIETSQFTTKSDCFLPRKMFELNDELYFCYLIRVSISRQKCDCDSNF